MKDSMYKGQMYEISMFRELEVKAFFFFSAQVFVVIVVIF